MPRPAEWFVDGGYIAFLAENQASVVWGVEVAGTMGDPPVFQGVRANGIHWYCEDAAPRSSCG